MIHRFIKRLAFAWRLHVFLLATMTMIAMIIMSGDGISKLPIILLYFPKMNTGGKLLTCGDDQCHISYDKSFLTNPHTKAIVMYGPHFFWDYDLPLPRQPHHEWGLLYDETPDANFLLQTDDIMNLFNHTATPQRTSDFPITLQYLPSLEILESKKYLLSTRQKNELRKKGFAPANALVGRCQGSSDRINFLERLMNVMEVDSYGKCLNTRSLPRGLVSNAPMESEGSGYGPPLAKTQLLSIIAQYKFTLVLENAICKDYVTEKLWRTLMVGSVPIYLGSYETIKDLLPSEKSVIAVSDFNDVFELANYIKFLDENDEEYEKYLSFKYSGVSNTYLKHSLASRRWKPSPIFDDEDNNAAQILKLSCMICERVHENFRRDKRGEIAIEYKANMNHYHCEESHSFSNITSGSLKRTVNKAYSDDYSVTLDEAKFSAHLIAKAIHRTTSTDKIRMEVIETILRSREGQAA